MNASLSRWFGSENGKWFPRRGLVPVFHIDERFPEWAIQFVSGKGKDWHCLCVARPGCKIFPGFCANYFWGRIHPSSSLYALEKIIDEFYLDEGAAAWHNAFCQSLCELDVTLGYSLIQCAPKNADELADFLFSSPFAEFGQTALEFRKKESGSLSRKSPPRKDTTAFVLWQAGALDISFDGRELLHPAAMLAAGLAGELKIMITAGQSRVFIPLAASVHSWICGKMDRKYGSSWRSKKTATDDDKHNRELGPLHAWLRRHYQSEWRLANLSLVWMNVRNCMAHNDFLPPTLALKAMSEYRKSRRAG